MPIKRRPLLGNENWAEPVPKKYVRSHAVLPRQTRRSAHVHRTSRLAIFLLPSLIGSNACASARVTSRSITELRIPIRAAAFRRGVEQCPQRIEIRRATRILSGIGRRTHLAAPEMADRSVATRERIVGGYVGITSADIVAG